MVQQVDMAGSDENLQFWNTDTGALSGTIPIEDSPQMHLTDGQDDQVTVARSRSAPEKLASSGLRWFEVLCAIDARPMTADEAALAPVGASVDPCAG